MKGKAGYGRKNSNIEGVIDYTVGGIKSLLLNKSDYQLSYKEIRNFPQNVGPSSVKRLGVLFFEKIQIPFDLKSSNKVIIKRETPVVEVVIPRVDFSKTRSGVLRPGLMSRSLDLLASHLQQADLDSQFIMGLTHPGIGKLAKRWNLLVEEHPFPKEIYQFIDMGLKDEQADPIKIQSLEVFRNQVLVYQPRSEFLQRIK